MTAPDWKELVAGKQNEQAKQLPETWRISPTILQDISAESHLNVLDFPRRSGLLTAEELDLTENYDAVDLVNKMANKQVSAHAVTLAFCKRAAVAQQVTNCLTEMFFDEALERAKYLDERLAKDGKPAGPLHGLPISLKDTFNMKGKDAIVGYAGFIPKGPADFNSPLVDILLDAGAVLYVKTNVPQTLWVADSVNNVFGRTLNPHNFSLTAGGSSGGEGAFVAMRGSLIGVGTDIAGSIRVPALCCGLYGFKPSSRRVAYGLQADAVREGDPLMEIVPPVAGPLCHSIRDARLFLETVIQDKYFDFDFTTIAVPWRPKSHKSTLTIGVLSEAPGHPVSPPIRRAVETAAKKLRAAGHTIVPLKDYPSFGGAVDLAMRSFAFDNDNLAFQWVTDSGEPFVKPVSDCYAPENMPKGTRTLDDLFPESIERDVYKKAWHDIYREHKLDIIIAPGNETPAPPHDTYDQFTYTLMWNLVQYPAWILPYSKVDKRIDAPDSRIKNYDPNVLDGVPCHIQIVGRPYGDEDLTSAAEVVDAVLKDHHASA